MNSYLDMLKRLGSSSGNISYPISDATPFSGNIPFPSAMNKQIDRYSALTPSLGNVYGNPDPSWWDKLSSGGIDWQQGIQDLAGMSFPTEEAGGMISGGRVGKGGPSLADFSPISMGGGAPNPGWPLVHPRRKEEQYAGPFVPTQMWSLG